MSELIVFNGRLSNMHITNYLGKRSLCLLAALIIAYEHSFSADQIHWSFTGQNSVSFAWRGTEEENKLFYGTVPGRYTEVIEAFHPKPLPTSSSGPFWEAKIGGLQKKTLYYYKIGNSPEHTFRPPPPRGTSDFTVVAQGDIGSTLMTARVHDIQAFIAGRLPSFVLALGDLSYGDRYGKDNVDRHFNDVMVWSQDAAYMPSWGNHEWSRNERRKGVQLNEYEGRFDLPHPQTSAGAENIPGNGFAEDWYWFDFGNVRFISYPEPLGPETWPEWASEAGRLMDEAETDPAIDFIVTFGHRAVYATGSSTMKAVMNLLRTWSRGTILSAGSSRLKNIFDALGDTHHKYVLNINGHIHQYERTFPQHGIVHITVGTGGASLETGFICTWIACIHPSWSAFRSVHHGILQLHFMKTGIEGRFFCGPAEKGKNNVSCNPGESIDAFSIAPRDFLVAPL
ncbi:MAG: purple acid phosphatase family protein [Gammaproteobacteria bacterium]